MFEGLEVHVELYATIHIWRRQNHVTILLHVYYCEKVAELDIGKSVVVIHL